MQNVNSITDDSYLVSFDVRPLYINIPYTEGTEAVKTALQKSKPSFSISIIIPFLSLILALNNIVFPIEKRHSAIGTKCAPSCANLFVGLVWSTFYQPSDITI